MEPAILDMLYNLKHKNNRSLSNLIECMIVEKLQGSNIINEA